MISFSFQVAKRFKQPKTQDSYIKFVSSVSTIGVALGSAVLILLLSVMNGFEYELRNTLLKVVPHGEIFSIDTNGLVPDPDFENRILQDIRVAKVFTLDRATGLLQFGKNMKAVTVVGADSEYFDSKYRKFSIIDTNARTELTGDKNTSDGFHAIKDGIVLGEKLLKNNQISVGDRLQILLPANTSDLSFKAPKSAWVTVIGSISVGGELDNQLAILNKPYLAELLNFDQQQYTHLEVQLYDPFMAQTVIREYGYQFSQAAYISDWTRTKGHLYQDIQLIRLVVYIVLTLVIAVACFNIVSALVMSVEEKSKEIAILKTIGASNQSIALIFIFKGLYHGLKGAVIGTVLGVLLALYLNDLILFIEWIIGIEFISGDIYFTKSIPSKLNWTDVFITSTLVVLIAVIATLYPARQAAKLAPAANLH